MQFTHKNQEAWQEKFKVPNNRQSPIDIPKGTAPLKQFPLLQLKNQKKTTWALENNGNFVKMTIGREEDKNVVLVGGPLQGEYKFDHLIFHWGITGGVGSEHSYDGASFEGEIHYQFTCAAPAEGQDSVAILCLNMKQASERKTSMMAVQEKLSQITDYRANTQIANMCFFRIMNACFQESDYFTYPGSLTYPPCTENVTYIVFEKPGEFSPEMFSLFRQMLDAEGNRIESNHRLEKFDLGERPLFRCKHPKRTRRSAAPAQPKPDQEHEQQDQEAKHEDRRATSEEVDSGAKEEAEGRTKTPDKDEGKEENKEQGEEVHKEGEGS